MRTVGLVMLAIILAGCTASEPIRDMDDGRPDAPRTVPTSIDRTMPDAEPPLQKLPLDLTVAMPDRWVKPRQPLVANVTSAVPGNITWFVRAFDDEVRVAESADFWYVGGKGVISSTPRHRAMASVALAPGESTASITMPAPSRVKLGLTDHAAAVNVTVDPAADPLMVGHATLVHDAYGLRFSPSEVTIHPDGAMRLWNGANAAYTFVEHAYWLPVTARDGEVNFLGVDPGAYEVMALARTGDAWGESAVRFVVDFESPPARLTIGPYSGRVGAVSTLDAPSARSHVFTVLHPMQSLSLTLRPSGIPEDATLTWTLERDGTRIGGGDVAAMHELQWGALPAGEYHLTLSTDGVRMNYDITGSAHHALSPPADAPSRQP